MEYNRAQLKQTAKTLIKEANPRPWSVALVMAVIQSAMAWLVNAFFLNRWVSDFLSMIRINELIDAGNKGDLAQWVERNLDTGRILRWVQDIMGSLVWYEIASLVVWVISSVLLFGFGAYALRLWRREHAGYDTLFSMFPRMISVFAVSFLVGLFSFLWFLPVAAISAIVIIAASFAGSEVVLAIALLLVYLLSIFLLIWVVLRYAMAAYWIITDRACGAVEAIHRSKQCMKGNKRRLLFLGLSFLGWYLLMGILCALPAAVGSVIGILAGNEVLAVGLGLLLGAVGAVASIPLALWLRGYVEVAQMGFFDIVAQSFRPVGAAPPPYTPPTVTASGHEPPVPPSGPPVLEMPDPGENPPPDEPWHLHEN